jgi:hypothetical protein
MKCVGAARTVKRRRRNQVERLRFHAGYFFDDPYPTADMLVMGHMLHDCSPDQNRTLLRKCYDALPPGGYLIVYDAMINDERRTNTFGL